MKLLDKVLVQKQDQRRAELYQDVLRDYARQGGELFGPVPAGHRREFFCLDRHTWVWHEEWTDVTGQRQVVTTRYTLRPNGILKAQGNNTYQMLAGDELRNFVQAVRLYHQKVWASLQPQAA